MILNLDKIFNNGIDFITPDHPSISKISVGNIIETRGGYKMIVISLHINPILENSVYAIQEKVICPKQIKSQGVFYYSKKLKNNSYDNLDIVKCYPSLKDKINLL